MRPNLSRSERYDPDPYPGLRPFRENEQSIFFGRGRQIGEVLRRLHETHFTAIVGGSGSGKSSLLRAGVVPELRAKGLTDRGDFWLVADFTPKDRAVDNLAKAIAAVIEPNPGGADEHWTSIRRAILEQNSLGAFLESYRNRLVLETGQPEESRSIANLLVICDQFEEIFRNRQDDEARRQAALLVDLIVEAYESRNKYPTLHVIIGIRSDDLHRTSAYIKLPTVINAANYLTRRLDEGEIAAAIIEPMQFVIRRAFREHGLKPPPFRPVAVDSSPFHPEVMRRLYDDVTAFAYDPDHLPLLQHLLSVIWQHVKERALAAPMQVAQGKLFDFQITPDDLAALLGFQSVQGMDDFARPPSGKLLARALDREANRALERNPNGKQVSEAMFRLLGYADDRGNYKRRWTSREEIRDVSGDDGARIEAVIAAFSTPYPFLNAPGRGPEDKIDVSHESFIRKWDRFGRWLTDEHQLATAFVELKKGYVAWRASLSDPKKFPLRRLRAWFGRLNDERLRALDAWWKSRRRDVAWARRYEHGSDEEQARLEASEQRTQPPSLRELRGFYRHSWWLSRARKWTPLTIPLLVVAVWLLGQYLWLTSMNQEALRTYPLAIATADTLSRPRHDPNFRARLWEALIPLEALDVIEQEWRNPPPWFAFGRWLWPQWLDLYSIDGFELASMAADRAARMSSTQLIWPVPRDGARHELAKPNTSWPAACRGDFWSRNKIVQDQTGRNPSLLHHAPAPLEGPDGYRIALLQTEGNAVLHFVTISGECQLRYIVGFGIPTDSDVKVHPDLQFYLLNTSESSEGGFRPTTHLIRVNLTRQCEGQLKDGICSTPLFVWDGETVALLISVEAPYDVTVDGNLQDRNGGLWEIGWHDKIRMLSPLEVSSLDVSAGKRHDGARPSPDEPVQRCSRNNEYTATLERDGKPERASYILRVVQDDDATAPGTGCIFDRQQHGATLLEFRFLAPNLVDIDFGRGEQKGYILLYGAEKNAVYKVAWARERFRDELCKALRQEHPNPVRRDSDRLPGAVSFMEKFRQRAQMAATLGKAPLCGLIQK